MRWGFIIFISVFCFAGCAKIVMPVGGPRDVTPPVITRELPPNGNTNFKGNVIKITFNEFVTLENALENVLISPPLKTPPTFTLSGKTLSIKIHDTLQTDQTYNFGFVGCIRDFTEGNPIPYYNYAFSTGNSVDSMQLNGKVLDAFTAQPVADCFVFAYSEDVDSLPLTTRPQYIGKTQNNGVFLIKNIKEGDYKLFALKDINNNLIFDLPNEAIAFSEKCCPAVYVPPLNDTSATDSSTVAPLVDSLQPAPQYDRISLQLFLEEDTTQAFLKMQNKEPGKYEFFYKNNIRNLQKRFLSDSVPDFWEVLQSDTLIWYMKEPIKDTLRVELTVNDTVCDTLALVPFRENDRRRRTERKPLQVNAQNQGELYLPLTLQFGYPIRPVEKFVATVIAKHRYGGNDTSELILSIPDSLVTHWVIPLKPEKKVVYSLIIRDSVFQGYNGLANDTVKLDFTTKTEKDYGLLRIAYQLPDNDFQYIATLTDSRGGIISSDILTESKILIYSNLLAGNYNLKVIEDRNANGRWDTGNYRRKIKPERVIYFSKSIAIRGFWELEETFEINEEE